MSLCWCRSDRRKFAKALLPSRQLSISTYRGFSSTHFKFEKAKCICAAVLVPTRSVTCQHYFCPPVSPAKTNHYRPSNLHLHQPSQSMEHYHHGHRRRQHPPMDEGTRAQSTQGTISHTFECHFARGGCR